MIAKVTRDRLMHQLHEQYPLYNFAGRLQLACSAARNGAAEKKCWGAAVLVLTWPATSASSCHQAGNVPTTARTLHTHAGHKGYCVPEHVEAIRRHGPCPQHRRTFAPVKTWYPLEPAEGEAAGQQQKAANKGSGGGRKKRS